MYKDYNTYYEMLTQNGWARYLVNFDNCFYGYSKHVKVVRFFLPSNPGDWINIVIFNRLEYLGQFKYYVSNVILEDGGVHLCYC